MREVERQVAKEIRAMTRKEVIVRAIAGELTWLQAAAIAGITPRHLRRLKRAWERRGYDGLQPEYGYTRRVEDRGARITLGEDDYRYYHKLYLPDAHRGAPLPGEGDRELAHRPALPVAHRPAAAAEASGPSSWSTNRASSPARSSISRTRRR